MGSSTTSNANAEAAPLNAANAVGHPTRMPEPVPTTSGGRPALERRRVHTAGDWHHARPIAQLRVQRTAAHARLGRCFGFTQSGLRRPSWKVCHPAAVRVQLVSVLVAAGLASACDATSETAATAVTVEPSGEAERSELSPDVSVTTIAGPVTTIVDSVGVPTLSVSPGSDFGLAQPLISEAFEQIPCGGVAAQLSVQTDAAALAGAYDFVGGRGVCAVNLVPGLTWSQASVPDGAGLVAVLLLRNGRAVSGLPDESIAEFVTSGGETLSVMSATAPYPDDVPARTDAANGFAAFVVGDRPGVMVRATDAVVAATWNGPPVGDRFLRFVAGASSEAAVAAIVAEVEGAPPTFVP